MDHQTAQRIHDLLAEIQRLDPEQKAVTPGYAHQLERMKVALAVSLIRRRFDAPIES